MERIVKRLIKKLHGSMLRKLTLVWPKPGGWFPPEANITFEIARLGMLQEFGYEAYGECPIGRRQHADMVLVSRQKQWLCHVECKLVNPDTCKDGSVLADLKRVATSSGLRAFLDANSAENADALRSWRRFGLFIGADVPGTPGA